MGVGEDVAVGPMQRPEFQPVACASCGKDLDIFDVEDQFYRRLTALLSLGCLVNHDAGAFVANQFNNPVAFLPESFETKMLFVKAYGFLHIACVKKNSTQPQTTNPSHST